MNNFKSSIETDFSKCITLASMCNGRQYGSEITPKIELYAENHGLMVCYGVSDDIIEIQGEMKQDFSAWEGTTIYFINGRVPGTEMLNMCKNDVPKMIGIFKQFGFHPIVHTIKAIWEEIPDEPNWRFETSLPHTTFMIYEDDRKFSQGIVFEKAELTLTTFDIVGIKQ